MMKMKSVVVFSCLLCVVWGIPEIEEELPFKRLYVDPVNDIDEDSLPRIIEGFEAPPHSIPYQAYLIIRGYGLIGWICSGSLISRKFVVTAGHCLTGGLTADVYLGAHNVTRREDTQLRVTSVKLTRHEKYNLTGIQYDIGVVELPEEVELNEYIKVVRLPRRSQSQFTYIGSRGRFSGWGRVAYDAGRSPVLLEAYSNVITNRLCDYYFGIVKNYQICVSGYRGVGACNGDAGGPLIIGNTLIGISSYRANGCMSGHPSVFTKTNSFLDWLGENTDVRIR